MVVTTNTARLQAEQLVLAYGQRRVLDGIDLSIPDGAFTAIIGPNGCGKSSLLKSFARVLSPQQGGIRLDGIDIASHATTAYARQVSMLPQGVETPEGITVRELVQYGRAPYQRLWGMASASDRAAVARAMSRTQVDDLAERPLAYLSGGQRQRAWLAMVLAQDTPIILLDEPTTYLDINHQHELLELIASLRDEGRTLVAVLHDINQAARYADHIVALGSGGRIYRQGSPFEVVNPEMMRALFELECVVDIDDVTETPRITPLPGRFRSNGEPFAIHGRATNRSPLTKPIVLATKSSAPS